MGLPVNSLPVLEEFVSVQGEGVNVGRPYYFIRVGGCPLRCNFCDTEYSWKLDPTTLVNVHDVAERAFIACNQHGIEWVSITGGEPLLYPKQLLEIMDILKRQSNGRIKVHIETSGRFYDINVHEMCDIYSADAKTPCTGETMNGFFSGIEHMRDCDQVKCLIANEEDLAYAHAVNKQLGGRCTMVLQPFNTTIPTDSVKNMAEEVAIYRNTPDNPPPASRIRRHIGISLKWLLETFHSRCARGEQWQNVVLTPQIHVLAYGNMANT